MPYLFSFLNFDNLWPLIQGAGLPGVALALVVFVLVFVLEFTHLLPNPTARRYAAVVLSALFSGAVDSPELFNAAVAALGLMGATLVHMLVDALVALAKSNQAKK